MKSWNTWVACLGCAGLCLALVGCGGSNVPDPDSDSHAATGSLPQEAPPPAVAQTAPEPAPAPAPAPAPEATAAPAPASASAPAAEATPAQPNPNEPATPPAAASPAPGADATAKVDNNPFAVFSETQSPTPPAAAAVADVPPQELPPAGDANPPADAGGKGDALGFLAAAAANRGNAKLFNAPNTGAMAFLAAIKEKDLNKIAQATALHAATESKNQKLFQLILSQELAQEDLDELAKKLAGFTYYGQNQPKESGKIGIIVSKMQGKSSMRRTITMRHEKYGWKVQDISGEGEIQQQIMMPMMRGGRGGGRR